VKGKIEVLLIISIPINFYATDSGDKNPQRFLAVKHYVLDLLFIVEIKSLKNMIDARFCHKR